MTPSRRPWCWCADIMIFQNPPYMASRLLLIARIAAASTSFSPLPWQPRHGYRVTRAHRVEVHVGADGPASAPPSGGAAAAPPAGAPSRDSYNSRHVRHRHVACVTFAIDMRMNTARLLCVVYFDCRIMLVASRQHLRCPDETHIISRTTCRMTGSSG
jgi:hypothetical protein